MRALLIMALGVGLAACAIEEPLETDLVKDRADAIQRVKNECVNPASERYLKSAGWHAVFSKGKWDVRLGGYDGSCPNEEGLVQAADGKVDCLVCVD